MDERLKGKGNYTFDDLKNYCGSLKMSWNKLESLLEDDYNLTKLIIRDARVEGWGINYRADDKSLCCIHPEKNALVVVLHIREEKVNEIKSELSDYAISVWDSRHADGRGGWIWYKIYGDHQVLEIRKLLNKKITPNVI